MKRRFLSLLLVVCMVFTMLPTTVLAAESAARSLRYYGRENVGNLPL